ncbi:uncharacterized protein LOC121957679 isoform X2 [Plectropomus leopardus]|uniref:uncharacterized protein LOC121957679 isoform X2 n=1 Tax=Plectropomus leopardus TaxID=160734 RepID=UPI001C4C91B8|nr:uncharacterized protein LOC121957679 isoform X2 [Plectropomus leopardus]XP_042362346.1 uncharacterized protein LOC121957679 isoform X2 [Plectropomus leopardus]
MVHRWKRTGRDCKNKAGETETFSCIDFQRVNFLLDDVLYYAQKFFSSLGGLCAGDYMVGLMGKYTDDLQDILITLEKQNVVTERDQLNMSLSRAQTSINELQTRYDNLNKSYSQLEDEKYRLEGKMAEKEELQTRYNNLRKIYRQLEDDRNHLKRMVESMESRVSYSGDLFGAFTHLSPF